ncbi:MAG: hypothetical protein AB7O52_16270 [Planctomycetota bacterium]
MRIGIAWHVPPGFLALRIGDIAKVKLLEAWGSDTSACAQGSLDPLGFAVQGRNREVLRWLLQRTTDVNLAK